MKLPPPPMLPGLPVLGNLLEYQRDHVGIFWRGYRTYGSTFSIRLGRQPAAVILGPRWHQFFFAQTDHALSMTEVYRFVIPMFGPILNAAETPERRKHLAALQQAFRARKMPGYIQIMAEETGKWLAELGPSGSFELWPTMEQLSMNIAASALMSREVRERLHEFLPLYQDLANGMEFVLPPNLPIPRFIRRDRARRKLDAMIRPLLAERRASPGRRDDFLDTLVQSKYPDGTSIPDETIIGLVLMTIFGAYETTAAQTCWVLISLLQHPQYVQRLVSEQDELLSEGPPNQEMLHRMQHLDRALKEAERLYPVFSHYTRYTVEDYEVEGYRVPRGWLTMVCPAVSHRLPELFDGPDVYDPDRFAPDRAEDRKAPHALMGFGGGYYKCPGMRFGVYEMKVILSLLLRGYELELHDPNPKPDYNIGIIRPKSCTVRYRRRS